MGNYIPPYSANKVFEQFLLKMNISVSLQLSSGKNPTYDVKFSYEGNTYQKCYRFDKFRQLNDKICKMTQSKFTKSKFPPDLWTSKFGSATEKQLTERCLLLEAVTYLMIASIIKTMYIFCSLFHPFF